MDWYAVGMILAIAVMLVANSYDREKEDDNDE